MKNLILPLTILFAIMFIIGCSSNENKKETVEQKVPVRPPVKIGSQTWTTQNLDVDAFRNGKKIPEDEFQS